jgi:hypothetical protein
MSLPLNFGYFVNRLILMNFFDFFYIFFIFFFCIRLAIIGSIFTIFEPQVQLRKGTKLDQWDAPDNFMSMTIYSLDLKMMYAQWASPMEH